MLPNPPVRCVVDVSNPVNSRPSSSLLHDKSPRRTYEDMA